MRLLAVDTSTEACSAALLTENGVSEKWQAAPSEHARLLMPMIRELLEEAGLLLHELDALAYGRGPGSFTGLRIASGVVQGLALSLDKPAVPVSVLAALASRALASTRAKHVCAALDARMQEVYWGVFERDPQDRPIPAIEEQVCEPGAIKNPRVMGKWAAIGSGWSVYGSELAEQCGGGPTWRLDEELPHARDIATLAATGFAEGKTVTAEAVQPVYLRNRVARKQT